MNGCQQCRPEDVCRRPWVVVRKAKVEKHSVSQGHDPRPAMIAITGYGGEKATDRALAAGFDYYMIKPVDPEALLTLLNSTL